MFSRVKVKLKISVPLFWSVRVDAFVSGSFRCYNMEVVNETEN